MLGFIALDPQETMQWNMDPYNGVFGGFSASRVPILIYEALICNMIGKMGFVLALEYFDTVIIAVATL